MGQAFTDDDFMWMTAVIAAWRARKRMITAVRAFAVYLGALDVTEAAHVLKEMPSCGKQLTYKSEATAWLAIHFLPVSEALFNGATDAQAIALWKTTPQSNNGPNKWVREKRLMQKESKEEAGRMRLRRMRSNELEKLWHANHDWKTVK